MKSPRETFHLDGAPGLAGAVYSGPARVGGRWENLEHLENIDFLDFWNFWKLWKFEIVEAIVENLE